MRDTKTQQIFIRRWEISSIVPGLDWYREQHSALGQRGYGGRCHLPRIHPPGDCNRHGVLLTVPELREAFVFATQTAAFEAWRVSYGMRPDGKPNRPLTAFTVIVEKITGETA